MKLGKLAPKYNRKTLFLSRYLATARVNVPPPPGKVWREFKVPSDKWGMFDNDTVGDCTCAEAAHELMLMTAHTSEMVMPTLEDVITMYSAVSGYVPGEEDTDQGAAITDILDYRKTVGFAGHKILGWAKVDNTNLMSVKQAIWLFGAVNIGINVPDNAQDQFSNGKPWNLDGREHEIEGGHCIPIFGYGSEGASCITWGARQEMSWDWFRKYCDEAYAVITEDWMMQATGLTPSGFNLAQLQSDLKALAA